METFTVVFLYSLQFFKGLYGPVILNAAGKRKDIKRSVLFSCTDHTMSLKHQLYILSFMFLIYHLNSKVGLDCIYLPNVSNKSSPKKNNVLQAELLKLLIQTSSR